MTKPEITSSTKARRQTNGTSRVRRWSQEVCIAVRSKWLEKNRLPTHDLDYTNKQILHDRFWREPNVICHMLSLTNMSRCYTLQQFPQWEAKSFPYHLSHLTFRYEVGLRNSNLGVHLQWDFSTNLNCSVMRKVDVVTHNEREDRNSITPESFIAWLWNHIRAKDSKRWESADSKTELKIKKFYDFSRVPAKL